MNQHNLHLFDLPNEILFNILKKLNNIDVLYSLFDARNQRLHTIAQNEIFTNILNFDFMLSTNETSNQKLDRFCNEILPQIHHNVKYFILESVTMERILGVAHYPNLTQLKLFNVDEQFILSYFNDNSIFEHIREQITHLHLITNESKRLVTLYGYTMYVYALILPFFKNLEHLTIVPLSDQHDMPISLNHLPSTTFFSSILTKLDVHVEYFDDCLGLLDGRLKQLNTFIVQIKFIQSQRLVSYNKDVLCNLKCFSLICYKKTSFYDNLVVALLHHMLNLEQLTLYVRIENRATFVDGIQLQNQILIYMPRLQKFTFYINTTSRYNNLIHRLSNDDIQKMFSNINYGPVVSIVGYYTFRQGVCQIFSVPFRFRSLKWFINDFPPIIFDSVTHLGLWVRNSFQHEFFIQIAQSFPSLEYLVVENIGVPSLWNEDNSQFTQRSSSIVEYPHLISLTIEHVNTKYIDEFLNESKTLLPCLTELTVQFGGLKKVTENFRRDATRRNCAKVKRLLIENLMDLTEDVYRYFPSLSRRVLVSIK